MQKSDHLNELAAALVKARAKIKHPKKESTANAGTYSYKYADLPTVVDAFQDAFTSNGLSVVQTVGLNGTLTTMLLHSSGQWIADAMEISASGKRPQEIGSAITYARRYALACIAGIAAEDDDDGAAGSGKHQKASVPPPALGEPGDGYVIPFGKHRGKRLSDISSSDINGYRDFLIKTASSSGKPLSGDAAAFVKAADVFLGNAPAPEEDMAF